MYHKSHVYCVYKIHVPLQRNRRLKRQAHQCVPCTSSNSKNTEERKQTATHFDREKNALHTRNTHIPKSQQRGSQDQPIRSLSTAKRSKHIHLLPLVCVRLSMHTPHTHPQKERQTDKPTDRECVRCQVLFSNLEFDI